MKVVWKIHGVLEAYPLEAEEGREFILEFSEDGDLQHVIRGGPWQYKCDAFLVVALTLVSLVLPCANVGSVLGHPFRHFDHDRLQLKGNICDKFIKARVQLPLFSALQRWVTLAGEITGEEVEAQIRYEKLPVVCLFCGYIGHMEARCDLPSAEKKMNYSLELCVNPFHFDDPPPPPLLLVPYGQDGGKHDQHSPTLPWCTSRPANQAQSGIRIPVPVALVEKVVDDAARLIDVNGKEASNDLLMPNITRRDGLNGSTMPCSVDHPVKEVAKTCAEKCPKHGPIGWRGKR